MVSLFKYSTHYSPPAPVAAVTLRAKSEIGTLALLDSGADATMVPQRLLTQIGARFARTSNMTGITGRSVSVALYLIAVQIGDLQISGIKAIATKSSTEVIIGRDILNHLIVTLDGIAGQTEIS